MVRSMRALTGYRVRATDSMAGVARDFLFDDDAWIVRYLVVDTGSWIFSGRRVLVPAQFLGRPEWEAGVIPVNLSREQVTGKRVRRTARPSSRERARELKPHGAHARRSPGHAGASAPESGPRDGIHDPSGGPGEETPELSLRSAREVIGYRIDAVDGYAGRVRDLIVEDDGWFIRHVVVDTGRWLPGRKVLVVPLWIEQMTWAGRTARVGLHRGVMAACPQYRPSAPVNHEYEVRLYDYYGRPLRWR